MRRTDGLLRAVDLGGIYGPVAQIDRRTNSSLGILLPLRRWVERLRCASAAHWVTATEANARPQKPSLAQQWCQQSGCY